MDKLEQIMLTIFISILLLFSFLVVSVNISENKKLDLYCLDHYNISKHTDVLYTTVYGGKYKIECGEGNLLVCESIWINETTYDKWGEANIKLHINHTECKKVNFRAR